MNAVRHADFDALSAYVDGEAPEWADHVEGCPRCRATAAELRALSATVGAPVEPPPAAQRDAAIAAALGVVEVEAGAGAGPAVAAPRRIEQQRLARRRWSPGSWALPAVAAVVVALLGLSGVILAANRSTDENATTFAGPALDSKAESSVAGAPGAPVGDLGDVPDAATLRARALGVTPAASSAGSARSSASSSATPDSTGSAAPAPAVNPAQSTATNTGNTGAAVSNGVSAPSGGAAGAGGAIAGGSATLTAPNAVGTRPCEERARGREPGLGPVTYFATARRGTVPAYVLGFGSGPNFTLLMLAQDGCGELLRSVGP